MIKIILLDSFVVYNCRGCSGIWVLTFCFGNIGGCLRELVRSMWLLKASSLYECGHIEARRMLRWGCVTNFNLKLK